MCVRKGVACPFYEEHAGEYFQGYWEHNDICYLGQDVEALGVHCTFDACWFDTEDPTFVLEQINKAFKAEYKRTIWNRKEHKWKVTVCKGADGTRRYNLKRDLDLIFGTLFELSKEPAWRYYK